MRTSYQVDYRERESRKGHGLTTHACIGGVLRWWIGQAELSLNLQAGRTIPAHQSPPASHAHWGIGFIKEENGAPSYNPINSYCLSQ
ncbi:hypothetical protein CBS63078_446 [Aspergillus niger]|nr:hypothetical protein CBS133816_652 [Aspergillus niger]KAI2862485.1 hypothetical protein CBS12448_4456 [Aspergillus niger]KAI2886925.1 hypothetical protein CBS13152_6922 [Aspergillus niger]KAI2918850.1 hypothetical protein CBS147371_3928 [Aspergillus niger]KAI2919891.1 hypothetical protein CBS147320_8397 [Aspergillus niger]